MILARYALRSLLARLRSSSITLLAITLFVAGGTTGIRVYRSLRATLIDSAPPDNVLVVGKGAPDELESILPQEAVQQIAVLDGIVLAAPELLSLVYVNATDFSTEEPVPIRGIDERSFRVHRAELIQGALPQPGSLEIIVGRRLLRTYPDLRVGADIALPGGTCKITGVFAAGNGPMELEIWTPRAALELHLKTKDTSSMTLVAAPGAVQSLVDKINTTKSIDAHAESLASVRRTSGGLDKLARTVLLMLILLGVVATFAIAMTINASVAIRLPELAALAAIGLRKSLLARLIVFESVALAFVGSLLGVGIAELLRRALGTISLSSVPVELEATLSAPLIGLAVGVATGLIGGLLPALAVRRLSIVDTLH